MIGQRNTNKGVDWPAAWRPLIGGFGTTAVCTQRGRGTDDPAYTSKNQVNIMFLLLLLGPTGVKGVEGCVWRGGARKAAGRRACKGYRGRWLAESVQ